MQCSKLLFEEILQMCDSEEELLEFDNLLRAMFFGYMHSVLSRENKRCNKLKRYKILSDNTGVLLDSVCSQDDNVLDLITVKTVDDMFNVFEDEKLFVLCRSLSNRDRKILYMKYTLNLTDREIAKSFHTSRQYITKLRNTILQTILTEYWD